MQPTRLGAACGALCLLVPAAQGATTKLTWDGYGSGNNAKCSIYAMHIVVTVDSGRVKGDWQQKGRQHRYFDFALGADGTFAGKVDISTGSMQVKGAIGPDGGSINLHGYCDFGGPLKKG